MDAHSFEKLPFTGEKRIWVMYFGVHKFLPSDKWPALDFPEHNVCDFTDPHPDPGRLQKRRHSQVVCEAWISNRSPPPAPPLTTAPPLPHTHTYDVWILIPWTCVLPYMAKETFAGVFQWKILRWGDGPAPYNHKSPYNREAGDQRVGDVMTEQEVWETRGRDPEPRNTGSL